MQLYPEKQRRPWITAEKTKFIFRKKSKEVKFFDYGTLVESTGLEIWKIFNIDNFVLEGFAYSVKSTKMHIAISL